MGDRFRPCQGQGEGAGVDQGIEVQEQGVGQDHLGGAVVSQYQRKEEAVERQHQGGEVIQTLKGGEAIPEGDQDLQRNQRNTRKKRRSQYSRALKSLSGRYPRNT